MQFDAKVNCCHFISICFLFDGSRTGTASPRSTHVTPVTLDESNVEGFQQLTRTFLLDHHIFRCGVSILVYLQIIKLFSFRTYYPGLRLS